MRAGTAFGLRAAQDKGPWIDVDSARGNASDQLLHNAFIKKTRIRVQRTENDTAGVRSSLTREDGNSPADVVLPLGAVNLEEARDRQLLKPVRSTLDREVPAAWRATLMRWCSPTSTVGAPTSTWRAPERRATPRTRSAHVRARLLHDLSRRLVVSSGPLSVADVVPRVEARTLAAPGLHAINVVPRAHASNDQAPTSAASGARHAHCRTPGEPAESCERHPQALNGQNSGMKMTPSTRNSRFSGSPTLTKSEKR